PLATVGYRLRCAMLLSKGTRSEWATTSVARRSWVIARSLAHSAIAKTHSWPTCIGVQGNGPNTWRPPAGMSATVFEAVFVGVQSVGQTRPMVGSEWNALTVTGPDPVVPLFFTRTYR